MPYDIATLLILKSMGVRKKNNAIEAVRRLKAKAKRDKNKVKREQKAATPGQKLHDLMHGRKKA